MKYVTFWEFQISVFKFKSTSVIVTITICDMCTKQKTFSFGRYVPSDKVLNKKVPENPRYKHVKPAVDTGKNIRKHIDELKEKQRTCSYKKDEVFKRIKIYAFIKLALACAAELAGNEYDIDNQCNSSNKQEAPDTSNKRCCCANVLMGIGELDLQNSKKKVHSSPTKPMKLMPYLLLDVRDRDAFSQCHIKTAKPYPSAMLSRSIGYEIEDLKLYKNSTGAIIILYDDDETIATRVATTLVERGYENVFLLTGGLKLAVEICPRGLTTSSQVSPVHMLHGANVVQTNSAKEHFSQEDIITIQNYVDSYPRAGSNLMSSTASSRSRTRSVGTEYNTSVSSAATSHTSTSSRRDCSCNSSSLHQRQHSVNRQCSKQSHSHSNSAKSIGQINLHKFQSVINDDTKKIKKAPWK